MLDIDNLLILVARIEIAAMYSLLVKRLRVQERKYRVIWHLIYMSSR